MVDILQAPPELTQHSVEKPTFSQPEEPKTPAPDSQEAKIATTIGTELDHGEDNRTILAEIAGMNPETDNVFSDLVENEQAYINGNEKYKGLPERYQDERVSALSVDQQHATFAESRGLKIEDISDLLGQEFSAEARGIIGEKIQARIDQLFNSEQGTRNPEKQQLVSQETQRYLDLITQAQAEGDLPSNLQADLIYQLVDRNVLSLAFQDRIATENLLGDHGIRHLVGHNIRVSETIADELTRNGQEVRAITRLQLHQVMIDHDIGYALDPVRNQVNSGNFDADRGHNVLAARVIRERAQSESDPLARVFTPKQIASIHEGILHHDSSEVDFGMGESSPEAQQKNMESIIHVADNTHAFEDKLPELLYSFPDSLRIMRLMKTAGEIDDNETFLQLQTELISNIGASGSLSEDDKNALQMAAGSLKPNSYNFSVGRICGNRPEFALDSQGTLTISVEESAIHQEVVGLFSKAQHEQLVKFAADLTGVAKENIDLDTGEIISTNGKLRIQTRTGGQRTTGETDYQTRVKETLAHDQRLQSFVNGGRDNQGDGILSERQMQLTKILKKLSEAEAPDPTQQAELTAEISRIKELRRQNFKQFLQGK